MAEDDRSLKHDPRAIYRSRLESAKAWWLLATIAKLGVFVVGSLAVLFTFISGASPFVVALLAGFSELCLWRSDTIKSMAERLHRELDAEDSFGWAISRPALSDLLAQSPRRLRRDLTVTGTREEYFASSVQPGPRRALENVQESAWWSKHLARGAGSFYLSITVILVCVSLAMLIASVETIRDFDVLSGIGRVVTSTIMLVFSLGLIRLSAAFYRFSDAAQRVEQQSLDLLAHKVNEEVPAIRLMYEYQVARAAAPMIPTWIWRLRRTDLNELWQAYRRGQGDNA